MQEKRCCGGAAVLVLAFLLPKTAGAADPKWHWHAHPGRHASSPSPLGAVAGLPPLSAPAPTAGADLPQPPTGAPHGQQQPAPHFGFPLQPPTLGSASAPPPGGDGYPFIGSNPTVPLPTGMTDTATVLPLPDSGDASGGDKVVGMAAAPVRVQVACMIGPLLFFG